MFPKFIQMGLYSGGTYIPEGLIFGMLIELIIGGRIFEGAYIRGAY